MKNKVLYYFPYAGASSVTYKSWGKYFDESIELKVLDYPGHGKRNDESFKESVYDICLDIYNTIKANYNDDTMYFLAGHCLGALVCYELCYLIMEKQEINPPKMIFISGHGAPDKVVVEGLYKMSDEDLIEYQKGINGIPEELLDEDFIDYVKEIVLPPIRYDSKAYESYEIQKERKPLDINAMVINGLHDWKSPSDEVERWNDFLAKDTRFINYDEDHYFINSMTEQYLSDINAAIIHTE